MSSPKPPHNEKFPTSPGKFKARQWHDVSDGPRCSVRLCRVIESHRLNEKKQTDNSSLQQLTEKDLKF